MILKLCCLYDFLSHFLITEKKEKLEMVQIEGKKKSEQTPQHGLSAAYVLGIIFMDYIITVNTSLNF